MPEPIEESSNFSIFAPRYAQFRTKAARLGHSQFHTIIPTQPSTSLTVIAQWLPRAVHTCDLIITGLRKIVGGTLNVCIVEAIGNA